MNSRAIVQKAQRKNEIRELQEMLHHITRYQNGKPSIIPDGIFGKETTQAIKDFQRNEGMEETGVVDYEVWDAIATRHRQVKSLTDPANTFNHFKKDIKRGDNEDSVYIFQILFNRLSRDFAEYEFGEVNGVFDERTHRNTKAFQKANGMKQDGIIDKSLWNRGAMYYNMF